MMIDPVTKGPHTYHTTNPVPFIVVDEARRPLRANGALQESRRQFQLCLELHHLNK